PEHDRVTIWTHARGSRRSRMAARRTNCSATRHVDVIGLSPCGRLVSRISGIMDPRRSTTRRNLLRAGLAAGSALAFGAAPSGTGHAAPSLRTDPFRLGVASGDPDPTSVVLWT